MSLFMNFSNLSIQVTLTGADLQVGAGISKPYPYPINPIEVPARYLLQ